MKRRRNTPEINVTPLVDVVLVLLIIFMVIAPQLEQGVRVELPGMLNPDPQSKTGVDPVALTLAADGRLFLDKEEVGRADLPARLAAAHSAAPERKLILKGDMAARYGDVRTVFRQAQAAGFPGVALVVGERKAAGVR